MTALIEVRSDTPAVSCWTAWCAKARDLDREFTATEQSEKPNESIENAKRDQH